MMKPRALDLFCCAGGVSKGLADAGFDVVGVDIRPQPEYVHPGRFVQGDALRPPVDLRTFDFIWASPPCQPFSIGAARWRVAGREYPDLVAATRAMLEASGVPYCIENVPGAPIRADLVLTGPMFGLKTNRRRHFEISGFFALNPPMRPVVGPKNGREYFTAAGHGGNGTGKASVWAEGMGVEWIRTRETIAQAIPPAYAEYIGRAVLRHVQPDRRAA